MDKMLRACLNWKVIGGLAVVGLGIWLVAPNLLVAALPILLIAVCPLSMVFMMRGMQGGQHSSEGREDGRVTPVAPSPDVEAAALKAELEAIDRRLAELDQDAEPTDVRKTPEGGAQIRG